MMSLRENLWRRVARVCGESFKGWWVSESRFVAMSAGGHAVLLLAVACLPMAVHESANHEAFAFDAPSPDLTEVVESFNDFVIGESPVEPTELNDDTLTIPEPPGIEMSSESVADTEPTFGDPSRSEFQTIPGGSLQTLSPDQVGPGPRAANTNGSSKEPGNGTGTGPGGPAPGFGPRDRNPRRIVGTGATRQSERSVTGGLDWLRRHQNPDGSWSLHKHSCLDRACTCNGEGDTQSDAAATAFALLPFLAAGQTQSEGIFKATVRSGLDWMARHQKADGSLAAGAAQTMYTHGLAAIVMCEAYGLSGDRRVGQSAQAAIRFIEAAQDPATGGWWYQPQQKGGDTSVFGWQLMALKSAQMSGLSVNPATLAGAQKWLKSVAKGTRNGLFEYRPNSGPTPTMTSVGVLATQYLGAPRNDPRIVEGMQFFMANMPNPKVRNCYYWYYATQVMHNLPGPEWDRWNREMRRVLIDSQIKEGCAAGSWDPAFPSTDPHGKAGGRVMVTSIATLTLEVYYRYLPLYQLDPTETPGAKPTID